MGNFSTKDGHGPTGPHLDLFHTPPTSPVTANLPTFPLPAPPTQDQQTPTAPLLKRPLLRIDPPTTSTTTTNSSPDCKTPLSVSPDHSVIGPGVSLLHNRVGSDAAPAEGRVASGCNGGPSNSTPRTLLAQGKSSVSSPTKSPLSLGSPSSPVTPSEQSWKENDSGLSQSVLEGHGSGDSQGEMERLIQEGRAVLDLSPSQDSTMSVTDLLRRLLSEVQSLRETMQTERGEWLQFQADLQVAVAVGDRLRAEAEEELSSLRVVHRDTEREMTAAQQRQKETDGQLVTLREELRESRQRLANLTQTHGKIQDQAPTQAQIETQCIIQTQDQEKAAADNNTLESHDGTHRGRERGINRVGKGGGGRGEGMGSQDEGTKVVVVDEARTDPKGVTKDVAKRYLRNMTNEERSGEEGRATHETCRIATTERSRSLSRLPVSSDSPAVQNGTSQSNAGTTTGSTNKNLCQPRGKRGLERQDSWSSIHTGKQEETLNQYNTALTDLPPNKSTKPRSQDGFSQLLRRHGGSKRNSLLRWCQSRTQGYKNIDITNFSSSWADGLAFCAVYHTYLPSHIPYCTLSPESKMENLSLAFKTGENVGITQSLTVEEMLRAGGPDWQRVLGYVESMYRHFEM